MVVFSTWTIGMPLFTSPDEAAHLYKAYGTAHFEALGEIQPGQSTNIRLFDVPQSMATPDGEDDGLRCYFFRPDVPAACAVGQRRRHGIDGCRVSAVLVRGHRRHRSHHRAGHTSTRVPGGQRPAVRGADRPGVRVRADDRLNHRSAH